MDSNASVAGHLCPFKGCYLEHYSLAYGEVHIPLSISICFIGLLTNIMNIVVLTRKHMRTPTNVILVGLSGAQLCLVSNYILLQALEALRHTCYEQMWSKQATQYKLLNVSMNSVFHAIALTHTVALALFRVAAMRYPIRALKWLKSQQTIFWSISFYVVVPILCAPLFFVSKVVDFKDHAVVNCSGKTTSATEQWDLEWPENKTLMSLAIWMYGIAFKLIPSFSITLCSMYLILLLHGAKQRKKSVLQEETISSRSMLIKQRNKILIVSAATTRMLIVVTLLCVLVEFPHGVINLLIVIYGNEFAIHVYDRLGDLLEMLTLAYSSVNFVLYCAMNTDYRRTFYQMYTCKKPTRRPTFSRRQAIRSKQRLENQQMLPKELSSPHENQQQSGNCIYETVV